MPAQKRNCELIIISNNIGWRSDIHPIRPDANFFSFLIGLIYLFRSVKTTQYLDQIDLFRLINPFKFRFSQSLWQTLEWCIALPELDEAETLSKLFFIEEQSIRNLIDFMNESNVCKGFLYVDFHHRLFEVAIDFEEECNRSWLLVQRFETRSIFLQGV
jgi:hypothetical protein